MKKLLILPMLLIVFISCKHKTNTVVSPEDTPTVTKDFRESYTGDFVVDIRSYSSSKGIPLHSNSAKQIRVNFSYSIDDTAYYYAHEELVSKLPALNMTIIDTDKISQPTRIKDHQWGMSDSLPSKLYYTNSDIGGVGFFKNTGGFIGIDSINFSYEFTEPKFFEYYTLSGKRIK